MFIYFCLILAVTHGKKWKILWKKQYIPVHQSKQNNKTYLVGRVWKPV